MTGAEHPALSRRDFYARLKELALPIAFQQFMLAAVSAGDAAMLGFVSQDALAAVSLAAQIQFVENLFLGALVSGATLIMAQYQGRGDRQMVRRVFHLILRYAAGIGLLFFGAALLAPRLLMGIFADEETLISIGSAYLRLAAPSYLLTGISQCWLCVMKTTGRAKWSAAISSFAMGLDTVLNAIFIFGLFGVPPMGARGAALTTSISRAVELLLVLCVNANLKMSIFAETKCNFSPVSTEVYTALIHQFTCRFEARQALIYQLVLGLTGENGKYNYSRAVHVYPLFFDITCSAKNYKIAPALTENVPAHVVTAEQVGRRGAGIDRSEVHLRDGVGDDQWGEQRQQALHNENEEARHGQLVLPELLENSDNLALLLVGVSFQLNVGHRSLSHSRPPSFSFCWRPNTGP